MTDKSCDSVEVAASNTFAILSDASRITLVGKVADGSFSTELAIRVMSGHPSVATVRADIPVRQPRAKN
jgi:hypothetical protein